MLISKAMTLLLVVLFCEECLTTTIYIHIELRLNGTSWKIWLLNIRLEVAIILILIPFIK